ncbi:uncharacterized protein PRCAT00003493001 [Priceomyces carsonii]|uniref:uncharacterized protein n=1 Tax=Priceomyces carsonii TaxID=28549 RepID=UPI002ED85820|nr:unnamed protein product [Priceomyces carsonii]
MVTQQERVDNLQRYLQFSSGKAFTGIILSEDREFERSEGSWSRPGTKNISVGATMGSSNE